MQWVGFDPPPCRARYLMVDPVPDGFQIKGVSQYVDKDGKVAKNTVTPEMVG